MTTPRSERVAVAVVDDSATMRRWLGHVLNADPRLTVVGEADSASAARELLRCKPVDVMTLDVDMPGISGIDFLERVMRHHPMPVVMISALTEEGSREAIKALSLGAVDCIEKPKALEDAFYRDHICNAVFMAAKSRVAALPKQSERTQLDSTTLPERPWTDGVVLLGASTGGVAALEHVLDEINGIHWPVVIAQHMPEHFLRSFARRLSEKYQRTVYMAQDGHVLKSGQVLLAVGKTVSTRLRARADGSITCQLAPPSENSTYRPCINDLFNSAAESGLNGIAALLTGMGRDGADGLLHLRRRGFLTLSQDEASSVVYGMPKAAVELGAAAETLSERAIGRRIKTEIQRGNRYVGDATL